MSDEAWNGISIALAVVSVISSSVCIVLLVIAE